VRILRYSRGFGRRKKTFGLGDSYFSLGVRVFLVAGIGISALRVEGLDERCPMISARNSPFCGINSKTFNHKMLVIL
jgi:hypothetical protein